MKAALRPSVMLVTNWRLCRRAHLFNWTLMHLMRPSCVIRMCLNLLQSSLTLRNNSRPPIQSKRLNWHLKKYLYTCKQRLILNVQVTCTTLLSLWISLKVKERLKFPCATLSSKSIGNLIWTGYSHLSLLKAQLICFPKATVQCRWISKALCIDKCILTFKLVLT